MSLLKLANVSKEFPVGGATRVYALDDVSLSVDAGETLAIIGESGSGKSTLGRLALRLIEPTHGSVHFQGTDVLALPPAELRRLRAKLQIIFQEPFESLNPRMRVADIVGEPLAIHQPNISAADRRARVSAVIEQVGLAPDMARRYPGELSGGQQQRVGIARAIVTRPALIVLDEPTSSLDLSVRAQILQLLADLQTELGMGYLFISHDIHTVRYVSDRIAVMYRGRVVETGPSERVFADPQHPYTRALLAAALPVDPDQELPPARLVGEPLSPTQRVTGCVLYGRCPVSEEKCVQIDVRLAPIDADRQVACVKPGAPGS
ncbi:MULTISPECIES: ABC transporter ATP-binding protein [Micromonospora]|uniref:Peptide/nickel transport system ATP-binding protein n=1 Tax=Micromonospora yangpuensis TaxID=683228 RepID=A0A1C6ULY0_9ACTN|nr:oligopeptide/dipeptide ABC transporter ATP-binding protein [Micromonospora yangpuensis]GGM18161.1 peptide ABC transporter ATP-binding protein [Micromonospora yangpuensis]SCL55020.1 peptide/nickel transport system ATP-binding protein [Micromonospora yangpuensis]